MLALDKSFMIIIIGWHFYFFEALNFLCKEQHLKQRKRENLQITYIEQEH